MKKGETRSDRKSFARFNRAQLIDVILAQERKIEELKRKLNQDTLEVEPTVSTIQ